MRYLAQHPCECGEDNPAALEFHHRERTTKKSSISAMVSNGYAPAALQEEIDKCDIMCANCHRKHEARADNWYKGTFAYD